MMRQLAIFSAACESPCAPVAAGARRVRRTAATARGGFWARDSQIAKVPLDGNSVCFRIRAHAEIPVPRVTSSWPPALPRLPFAAAFFAAGFATAAFCVVGFAIVFAVGFFAGAGFFAAASSLPASSPRASAFEERDHLRAPCSATLIAGLVVGDDHESRACGEQQRDATLFPVRGDEQRRGAGILHDVHLAPASSSTFTHLGRLGGLEERTYADAPIA